MKVMVMVKASAYGAGLAEVAQLMESEKVDYLTVAYIDEGVLLREAGIKIPILVLNPEPAGFDALFRYQLEPEIFLIGPKTFENKLLHLQDKINQLPLTTL